MSPAELHAFAAPHKVAVSMIGESESMQKVKLVAQKVATSDCSVMVLGETGTGKEVLSQYIHALSLRRRADCVAFNCAGIPDTLFESELFGHVRGAFTGALEFRKGLLGEASGGTLLLDEIGDMPHAVQAKLLRVLQERKFRRLGQTSEIDCDVRIIAATNRDLPTLISEGKFRDDLYYRLNVVTIELPPLRDRKGDVLVLAKAFAQALAQRNGRNFCKFSPAAEEALERYTWPGNVRELRNVIERAVVLADGPVIELRDLQMKELPKPVGLRTQLKLDLPVEVRLPRDGANLPEVLREIERLSIVEALRQAGGVQIKAAKLLGMSDRVLNYRIHQEFKIDPDQVWRT